MKVPGIVAVMVLGAASMFAQAAATAPAAPNAPAATTAPDAAKPADHAACMHHKAGMKGGKACHCRKGKDGNMAKSMDGHKRGMCPYMKKNSEKKS